MPNWMTKIFAGGPTSDLWAALVLLCFLIAIIAVISKLFERVIANLTHSILVALNDSTASLGRSSVWLPNQMILYRLRSMKSKTLNEAAFSKAQAVTDNAQNGSFEVKVIGEALGLWITTAFSGITDPAKRNALLEDIARLLRTPGEQAAPTPSPARPPQKKTVMPPAETEPPLQTANED
jgi:hypothetical protein